MTTYYTIQTWRNDVQEMNCHNLYETFDEACDALEKEMMAYVEYDESEFKKNKPNREEKLKKILDWQEVLYYSISSGHHFQVKKMNVIPNPKKDVEETIQHKIVDCDEEDKHLETHFDEIFKRSQKVKSVNGKQEENMWYDPVKQWVYYAYFPEGEKPQTFYDPESNNDMRTIEFEEKYLYQYVVENSGHGIQKESQKYASFNEACDAMDKELDYLHDTLGKPNWKPRMARVEFKKYMGDYPVSTYDFFNDGGPTTDKYVLSRLEA